jgi:hypothetical protein
MTSVDTKQGSLNSFEKALAIQREGSLTLQILLSLRHSTTLLLPSTTAQLSSAQLNSLLHQIPYRPNSINPWLLINSSLPPSQSIPHPSTSLNNQPTPSSQTMTPTGSTRRNGNILEDLLRHINSRQTVVIQLHSSISHFR